MSETSTDNIDELIQKLESSYLTKDKVEIIYLKNYAVVKNNELIELSQKVYNTCKSKIVDINTIEKFAKTWVENTLKNISTINNSSAYRLSDLENKFKGQTALILAAGPSLKDNIEYIKSNRDKYVIFVVNKSLKYILSEGIKPDFVVGLDAGFMDRTFIGLKDDIPNLNYITDLKSNARIFARKFNKVFVSFSENDLIAKKLAEYNKDIKTYECGGSATSFAFVAASKMGFDKIIFSGLDLAFKDNQIYANGENINKISEDTMMVDNVVKNLTAIPSVTGKLVQTRDDYAAFIRHFESIIRDSGYTEIYNTTSFGAAIPGMKNKSFGEISVNNNKNLTSGILEKLSPFKIETKEWINQELFLINNVANMLTKSIFSPALISSIVKSPILYQYMQAEILHALQSGMSENLAKDFLNNTKVSIELVIGLLKKNKLV